MSQDKAPAQGVQPKKIPQDKAPSAPLPQPGAKEEFTRKPDPVQAAASQNATPQRIALPLPAPKPLRKLTPAQVVELENLANVRWKSVQDAIAHNDPNTDALRRDLRTCAQEMLEVHNPAKLYTVLGVMMKLALRSERAEDRGVAASIYEEVLSYVPQHAPREAQRVRGICLQRLGNMQGGPEGCAKLKESLNLLAEAEDRGNSYLFLGKHQIAQPQVAAKAFEQAYQALKGTTDVPSQAKAIIHWAGVAQGTESDQRIAQRLSAAVQLLEIGGVHEPVYEANAYLELGRAQERIADAAADITPRGRAAKRAAYNEAWAAYTRARELADGQQERIVAQCVAALDGLKDRRFWSA